MATPPRILQREATSRSTGCAPTAQQGKSTAGPQPLSSVLGLFRQAAQSVVAERPASATRLRRCTLTEQQSGTMRRTQAGLVTTLLVLIMWSGGRLPSVAAGSKQLSSVHRRLIELKPGCCLLQAEPQGEELSSLTRLVLKSRFESLLF